MKSERRLIDADAITADSELIKTMLKLTRRCQFRHSSGCLSETCAECMANFFSPAYNHILPLTKP